MSKLLEVLLQIADHDQDQQRFRQNPESYLRAHGLSQAQIDVVMTGDANQIREAVIREEGQTSARRIVFSRIVFDG